MTNVEPYVFDYCRTTPFVSNTLYAYAYSCIDVLNMLDCYDER